MMYLDSWRVASTPIDIPILRQSRVVIGTPTGSYNALVESISVDLFKCKLLSTPPAYKHFKKGDDVVIHRDNILQKIDSR